MLKVNSYSHLFERQVTEKKKEGMGKERLRERETAHPFAGQDPQWLSLPALDWAAPLRVQGPKLLGCLPLPSQGHQQEVE